MTANGSTLRLLKYAFAARDHGSLRKAAKALRVQESCVSRNVVRLEQLLDMQLFERDVRGVRLTEAGRAWTDAARVHYEGLLDTLADGGRNKYDPKSLRIGLCWVRAGQFLKLLIDRFRRLNPDVSLSVEDVPAGQCVAAIRRRRLDIVFTSGLGAATAYSSKIFWQERLFVLLPPRHALTEKPVVTWADLADLVLLVPVGLEGPPLDLTLLERIAADGGPAVQACRTNQATVIFRVQIGQGVALAEESYARAVATHSATWKLLSGRNSLCTVRGLWLDSNPKRAALRFVGLAENMSNRVRQVQDGLTTVLTPLDSSSAS